MMFKLYLLQGGVMQTDNDFANDDSVGLSPVWYKGSVRAMRITTWV
ncbi:hypothetical protein [Candidatus Nitrosocosmicus sp. R]